MSHEKTACAPACPERLERSITMTSRLFTITAVALAAALSACVSTVPSPRVATLQSPGSQLPIGTVRPSIHCGYDQGGFNSPDAMKLPKDAFCSPE
jgi:hypothetical protein